MVPMLVAIDSAAVLDRAGDFRAGDDRGRLQLGCNMIGMTTTGLLMLVLVTVMVALARRVVVAAALLRSRLEVKCGYFRA